MVTLKFSGSGYFNVNNQDENYHGNLYLNKEHGGIMLTIDIFHDGAPLSYLALPLEIEYISGELTNGFKLTLLNCKRTKTESYYGSRDTFTYIAEFMLEGIKVNQLKDNQFTQVDFMVPDVIVWGDKSSYKIDEENYGLSEDFDSKRIEIFSNSKYSIEYDIQGSMLPVNEGSLLIEEIKLIQKPMIIVTAKNPQRFDYFIERYKLIKRYIEIAMKKEISLSEMRSYPSKVILENNGFSYETSVNINSYLIKERKENSIKNYNSHTYLFSLNEIKKYGDFNEYIQNAEKLEPIIDLYLDLIYSKDISAVRAFLNVTQALETYHSRFKYGGNIKGFVERIDEVILKKRPYSARKEDTKFLMAKSKKFVTLESRLAELLLAEFNIHFYTGKIKYIDFPNTIAVTRNYYTHYDEKLKSRIIKKSELASYVRILIAILEYYILEELGFKDNEFRRSKVAESLRDIQVGFDVKDAAQKQQEESENK